MTGRSGLVQAPLANPARHEAPPAPALIWAPMALNMLFIPLTWSAMLIITWPNCPTETSRFCAAGNVAETVSLI
eukprot:3802879-Pyramimonas_sp.AAC.1